MEWLGETLLQDEFRFDACVRRVSNNGKPGWWDFPKFGLIAITPITEIGVFSLSHQIRQGSVDNGRKPDIAANRIEQHDIQSFHFGQECVQPPLGFLGAVGASPGFRFIPFGPAIGGLLGVTRSFQAAFPNVGRNPANERENFQGGQRVKRSPSRPFGRPCS